jgi:hypothetical protein
MLHFIKQNIAVGICYVLLSLFIGECHPFSRVSMYDSFPDKSYTFYLSDNNGQQIPLKKHYRFSTGDLTHFYNAYCETHHISREMNGATVAQLQEIGAAMLAELKEREFLLPVADSIQLHAVYFLLKADSIYTHDILMYAAPNNR